MVGFLMAMPLFLTLASEFAPPEDTVSLTEQSTHCAHSPSNETEPPCQKKILYQIEKILTENPNILKNALTKNPDILSHVLTKYPGILFHAQQKMIADFSEKASDNVQNHTQKLLRNTPELWENLQKNAINTGSKNIVIFLDPLCQHSLFLLKDLLQLISLSDNTLAICPHWITQHEDIKGQLIVRSILAAHAMGKTLPFLERILECMETMSLKNILAIASELEICPDAFQKNMNTRKIHQHILLSRAYGNQFQFQGSPTILYKTDDQLFEVIEGRPESIEVLAKLLSA